MQRFTIMSNEFTVDSSIPNFRFASFLQCLLRSVIESCIFCRKWAATQFNKYGPPNWKYLIAAADTITEETLLQNRGKVNHFVIFVIFF